MPDLGKQGGGKPRREYQGKRRGPDRSPAPERSEKSEAAPVKGKKKSKFAEAIPSKKRPKKPADKNKGKRRKPSPK